MREHLFPAIVLCLLFSAVTMPLAAEDSDRLQIEPAEVELFNGETVAAEKGTFLVPENRQDPNSRTIKLAFIRFPSFAENPGPPVFYIAGGPGGSATVMARAHTMQPVRQFADLVFLDQRGAGQSETRLVYRSENAPGKSVFLDPYSSRIQIKNIYAEARAHFISQGIAIDAYNTVEAVEDLHEFRQAIGYEKLSLLGFSYGTHFSLSMIRRHGATLHRAILVGTEGPDHTLKLPQTYNIHIRKLSLLMAADEDTADYPPLEQLIRRVVDKLNKQPAMVSVVVDQETGETVEVPVSGWGVQAFLRMDIGDGNDIPVLPAMLMAADRGDYSLLGWFAQKRYSRFSSGYVFGMGAMTDASSGVSAERLMRIRAQRDDSLLGLAVNLLSPEAWEGLGSPDLGETYRSPIVSAVETLFISGTLDSNTPPYQAEEVRWGFANSHHLIVHNAGHEDMLPDARVQEEIIRFLKEGRVEQYNVQLPPPDFLSIDAAKERLGTR